MARRLFRVLSVDGGAIRGLMPALVIRDMARRLPGRPFGLAFDLVVGTSTGAIIGAGLVGRGATAPAEPLATPEKLVSFYRQESRIVFPRRRGGDWSALFAAKHRPNGLETVLRDICGDSRLSRTLRRLVVPAYDPVARRVVVFDSAAATGNDHLLRDVLRAATAAPTLFPPARTSVIGSGAVRTLIDGGVAINNPGVLAYALARQAAGPGADILLVSLGCGAERNPYPYEQIRRWGYSGWLDPRRRVPILRLVMGAQDEVADRMLQELLPAPDRYFRIEPALPPDIGGLDDVSDRNLDRLSALAAETIAARAADLDRIAELLAD